MSDNSKKRPAEELDIASLYHDQQELVNAVISVLAIPEATTNVSEMYANDKNQATEVQAYAKIAGNNWTYYVKTLSIAIGRNTDQQDEKDQIQIDLGPAKVVSRNHATIVYNLNTRVWELLVSGRNGAKVDGAKVSCGTHAIPTALRSGSVIDIGGTQMMFILPDAQPNVSPEILAAIGTKLPKPATKKVATNNIYLPESKQSKSFNHNANSLTASEGFINNNTNNSLKGFQMFNQDHSSSTDILTSKGLDNDLSKDEAKDIKPPYSYATMITQAILSNPEGVLSLSEIYDWIAKHYSFYRFSKSGWQNSIRHNLSLNKAFDKVPRRANEPGKGMKWQISESYRNEFLKKFESGSLSKVRRGSSVSRQLQLHLATHNELPKAHDRPSLPQTEHQPKQPPVASNQLPPPNPIQGYIPPPSSQYAYTQYQTSSPQQTSQNGSTHYLPPTQRMNTQLPPPIYQSAVTQHQFEQTSNPQDHIHSRGTPVASGQVSYQISQHPSPERQSIQNENKENNVVVKQDPQSQPQQQPSNDRSISNEIRPITQESTISTDRTEVVNSSTTTKEDFSIPPSSAPEQKSRLSSPLKQDIIRSEKLSIPPTSRFNNVASESNSESKETNLDIGLVNSPTKGYSVGAVEAYTPERGVNKKPGDLGPNGQSLQSSPPPALWNFVQFSTPVKGEKGSSSNKPNSNGLSPIKNLISDSPLNSKHKENIEDLSNVDLVKGFQK